MPLVTTDRVAFREALPEGGRLVGMDVGTKTIGLALCDARWSIASPAHTITRGKFSKDKLLLAAFITQQQVKGIVDLGRPGITAFGSRPESLKPVSPASRAAPSRIIWRISACRSCSGTNAGQPRRSPAR